MNNRILKPSAEHNLKAVFLHYSLSRIQLLLAIGFALRNLHQRHQVDQPQHRGRLHNDNESDVLVRFESQLDF